MKNAELQETTKPSHLEQGLGIIFWGTVALLVFVVALREISDPDFWWHLKTGEQMLRTKWLITQDDFAYTSAFFETLRERGNLQGYWAWQVLAACFYQLFGFAGISLMSGLMLAAIAASIVWRMRRGKTSFAVVCAVTAVVVFVLVRLCLFERPHIASFLFASVLMGLFESIRRGHRPHWLIMPLMVLWGNCHGGFIFGDLMLLLFAAAAIYHYKDAPKTRNAVLAWALFGLAGSLVSPNHINLFSELFSRESQLFFEEFYEFNNLFWWYANRDTMAVAYLAIVGIGFCVAMFRRCDGYSLLIAAALAFFAVKHVRMLPFYAVAVLPNVVQGVSRNALGGVWKKPALLLAAVGITLYGAYQEFSTKGINFPRTVYENNASFPVAAADFLRDEVRLQGNMFNEFRSGGYLIWKLYPQYRVFIDTRCLDYNLFSEYRKTADATQGARVAYRELFSKYGVDFVIRRHQGEFGRLDQLLKNLLRDDQWVQVYLDDYWYVAVRKSERNKGVVEKYGAAPQAYLQALYGRYSEKIALGQDLVKNYLSRADLALFLGNFPAAEADIGLALALSPGYKPAASMLNELSAYRRVR